MNRLVTTILVGVLTMPSLADAQRAPRARTRGGRGRAATTASAAPSAAATTPAAPELQPPTDPTPDSDTLLQAIQAAAVSGPDGAAAISTVILRGVTPRVAAAGLDALSVLAQPIGTHAVLRFLEHRRPMLRRHAIAAAQAIHTPELVTAVSGRLADSDENVRVDAAAALAEIGTPANTPALFAAFERDLEATNSASSGRLLHESGKAIARVGSEQDVQRLLGFLRRAPFRSMADAMRAALARNDLPEAFRVRIVQAVGDLATREVREFLNSVIADAHGHENAVTRAARTASDRIAE
jgi:HEAT repeat protein